MKSKTKNDMQSQKNDIKGQFLYQMKESGNKFYKGGYNDIAHPTDYIFENNQAEYKDLYSVNYP